MKNCIWMFYNYVAICLKLMKDVYVENVRHLLVKNNLISFINYASGLGCYKPHFWLAMFHSPHLTQHLKRWHCIHFLIPKEGGTFGLDVSKAFTFMTLDYIILVLFFSIFSIELRIKTFGVLSLVVFDIICDIISWSLVKYSHDLAKPFRFIINRHFKGVKFH